MTHLMVDPYQVARVLQFTVRTSWSSIFEKVFYSAVAYEASNRYWAPLTGVNVVNTDGTYI